MKIPNITLGIAGLGLLTAVGIAVVVSSSANANGTSDPNNRFIANIQSGPVPPTATIGANSQVPIRVTPQPKLVLQPASEPGGHAVKPPVTEAGIREFISKAASLPAIPSGSRPTISRIQFITAAEVRRIENNTFAVQEYPATAPMVYVELAGTFDVPKFDEKDAPITYSHGTMVFDGVTGNLLLAGAK